MKFDEVMESTDEMDQSSGTDEFIGVRRQMAKRKRTKRQRRITISSSCSVDDGCVRSRKDDRHNERFVTTLSEEEENMANCLIMLAQSGGGLGVEENEKTEKKRKSREQAEISAVPGGLNFAYECKTCNKAFQSFQALGGHRASHHKKDKQLIVTTPKSSIRQIQMASDLNKSTDSNTQQSSSSSKVHECSICGSVFSSGQALGGHMRRHRAAVVTSGNSNSHQMAPAASDATTAFATVESLPPHEDFLMNESCIISSRGKVMTSLDLNLPAPPEEDQVVSDHGRRRFINQQLVTSQNNRNPTTTAPHLVGCYF